MLHVLLVLIRTEVVDAHPPDPPRLIRATVPVLLEETEIGTVIHVRDLAIDMMTVIVETGIGIVTMIMVRSPTCITALVRGLGHPDVGGAQDQGRCRGRAQGLLALGCRKMCRSLFRW